MKALSAQPDTITLMRVAGYRWRDPSKARRLATPLLERGFIDLGIYETQPKRGFMFGVLLNDRDNMAAFLTEFPTGHITLELNVRYLDGTTTALVNYADNGVPRPPFFRTTFGDAYASSSELYERLLRERSNSGIKAITADNVIAEYEVAYAKINAYMKGRGLSAAEVAFIAACRNAPSTTDLPACGKPTVDSRVESICPHCGQINEPQREVCWACNKLLSGEKKSAVRPVSYQNNFSDPVPEPLREQLASDERLLWHGRPRDKIDLRSIPLLALPLTWIGGLLFGSIGVALLWLFLFKTSSWRLDRLELTLARLGLMLGGALFVLAGCYIMGGPFLNRFLRRGTFYMVTDRRVVIVHDLLWRRVISRHLTQLTVATVLNETWEGAGDIELGFDCWTSADSDLEFIENVREVESILLHARAEALAKPIPAFIEGDTPAFLAGLVVPFHYSAIALYILLLLSDVTSILRSKGQILATWAANQETGSLPPATVFLVVPVLIFFLYSRSKKFQAGTRVARTIDLALMAAFIVVSVTLLFSGVLSFPKTLLSVIFGVFLLLSARGRVSQTAS